MRGSSIVIPCMYPELSHRSRCVPKLVLESSVLHSSPHSPLRCVFAQLCPTLRPHGLWDFSGKNTGVGCHLLLWGIFLTQGSNLSLLHWRLILYHRAPWEAHPIDSRPYLFPTTLRSRWWWLWQILALPLAVHEVDRRLGVCTTKVSPAGILNTPLLINVSSWSSFQSCALMPNANSCWGRDAL